MQKTPLTLAKRFLIPQRSCKDFNFQNPVKLSLMLGEYESKIRISMKYENRF